MCRFLFFGRFLLFEDILGLYSLQLFEFSWRWVSVGIWVVYYNRKI